LKSTKKSTKNKIKIEGSTTNCLSFFYFDRYPSPKSISLGIVRKRRLMTFVWRGSDLILALSIFLVFPFALS
jgi:hypothetical protein